MDRNTGRSEGATAEKAVPFPCAVLDPKNRSSVELRVREPRPGARSALTLGMAVTRTKAEEFRRLAEECRATAQTLSTEQARAEMLGMADVCDRVAAYHAPDVSEAGAVVRMTIRCN